MPKYMNIRRYDKFIHMYLVVQKRNCLCWLFLFLETPFRDISERGATRDRIGNELSHIRQKKMSCF